MPKNTTVSYLNKHALPLRKSLAAWFDKNKRDLPWRRTPSLYPTVVSEFMLQQTQVKTVLPYFDRWMKRFPDFQALASADEASVLKHWEGLGYYSRARNLHTLAKQVSAMDHIPQTPEEWELFKGVGAYTAAAITSISFAHPIACVDGNVIRILARLMADETVYKDNTQATKAFSGPANQLLDTRHPGRHNEAMMELGATVCTKANPNCRVCPLSGVCKSRDNAPERLPRKVAKKIQTLTIDRAWILDNGKLLLHRANDTSRRLKGILELPALELLGIQATNLKQQGHSPRITRKRGISNSHITEPIWELSAEESGMHEELVWVPLEELPSMTLSGPHKRWIQELLEDPQLPLI